MRAILPKGRSYLRNASKSVLYATLDVAKDNAPFLNSLFKESKESVQDLYHSIKDFSSNKGESVLAMGKDAIASAFKNLKSDLASGDWYNKGRDEILNNQMLSLMGMNLEDFDFNLDDDNFDFGDLSDDVTGGDQFLAKQNAKNTVAVITATDAIGDKVATSINNGTIASANYIVSSSRAMNKALYDLNNKGFRTITEAVAVLNKNINNMHEAIGGELNTFMKNGTIFFSKTTEQLQDISDKLKILVDRTPDFKANANRVGSQNKRDINSIMSGGNFSISSYKDMVIGNVKEYTDMITSIFGMFGGGKGKLSDLAKGFSPLRPVLKGVIKATLPVAFKEALRDFDKELNTFLPSFIAKQMASESKGLVSSIFRALFLPKNEITREVGTRYNQGPIPFDGQTKKAITDVIPTYLSNILSVISGAPATKYDYVNGRFVRTDSIPGIKADRESKYAREAGGKFREDALKSTNNNKIRAEIENYFLEAFLRGTGFIDIKNFTDSKGNRLSTDTINILNRLAKSGKYNSMPADVMRKRSAMSREVESLTASGNALETALFDNSNIFTSKNGKLTVGKAIGNIDKYGNSALDYLRGIYINTLYGGGSGGRKKGKVAKVNSGFDLPNFNNIIADTDLPSGINISSSNNSDIDEEEYNKKVDAELIKLANDLNKLKNKKNKVSNQNDIQKQIDETNQKINNTINKYKGEAKYNGRADIILGASGVKGKLESLTADDDNNFVRRFFKKRLPGPVLDFFDRPITAVSDLLNTMTKSMTSFLWGDEHGNMGIFKQIMTKIENNATMSKFLDSLLGEKDPNTKKRNGLWNETKKSLGEYWRWMKGSISEKWDQTGSTGARYMDINPPASLGRRITKSGMIAVSDGEMVIPAELNPYYNKTINKRQQYRTEAKAMNDYRRLYGGRILGGFADGTRWAKDDVAQFKNDKQLEILQKGLANKALRDRILNGLQSKYNASGDRLRVANKAYYRQKDGTWRRTEEGSVGQEIANAFGSVKDSFKGLIDTTDPKLRERVNEFVENISPDLKVAKGRMGAGAIIGTGIGGLLGGPLAGMLIGAAAGFVSKSEKAQKALFGDFDEESGEYSGGLLGKKASNFLTKIAPDMVRGGSIGTIGGAMLLGGPLGMIGGLMTGTALSYARHSKAAQEYLFGKFDENGELIKKGLLDKDKLRKVAPRAIIGTGAMMLFGPGAGLFTKMVLGTGLGFLSTNEKVHDFLFGKKDENGKKTKIGLLNKISDRLFGGINDLFRNTVDHLKVTITNIGKNLLTKVNNLRTWFQTRRDRKKALDNVQKTRLRSIAEGVGSVAKGLGIGALAAPFALPFVPYAAGGLLAYKAPRWIANSRKRKNARRGYDIYDYRTDENGNYILDEHGRKVKGNLTAAERSRFRDKNMFNKVSTMEFGTKDRWDLFDESLANMDSTQLKQFQEDLELADENSRGMKQFKRKNLSDFYGIASKAGKAINSAQLSKISGMINNGDVSGVEKYINSEYKKFKFSSDEEFQKFKEDAKELASNVNAKVASAQTRSKNLLSQYGFTGDSRKAITKAQQLIKTELAAKTPEELQQETNKKTIEYQDKTSEKLDIIANAAKEVMDNGIKLNLEDNNKKKSKKKKGKGKASNDTSFANQADAENTTSIDNLDSEANFDDQTIDETTASTDDGYKGRNVYKKMSNFLSNKFHPKTRTFYNSQGEPIKQQWDNREKAYKPVANDKQYQEAQNAEEAQTKSVGILGSISSGIHSLKEKFFGSKDKKEDKESIFDKIKNIGKKLLFAGGIFAGIKLLPGLLPKIGEAISWIIEKAPSLLSGIWNVLSSIGSTVGNILSGVKSITGGIVPNSNEDNYNKVDQDVDSFGTDEEIAKRNAETKAENTTTNIKQYGAAGLLAFGAKNLFGWTGGAVVKKILLPVVAAKTAVNLVGKSDNARFGIKMIDYGSHYVDIKFSDGSSRQFPAVSTASATATAYEESKESYVYKWTDEIPATFGHTEDGYTTLIGKHGEYIIGKSPKATCYYPPGELNYFTVHTMDNKVYSITFGAIEYDKYGNDIGMQFIPGCTMYPDDMEQALDLQHFNSELKNYIRESADLTFGHVFDRSSSTGTVSATEFHDYIEKIKAGVFEDPKATEEAKKYVFDSYKNQASKIIHNSKDVKNVTITKDEGQKKVKIIDYVDTIKTKLKLDDKYKESANNGNIFSVGGAEDYATAQRWIQLVTEQLARDINTYGSHSDQAEKTNEDLKLLEELANEWINDPNKKESFYNYLLSKKFPVDYYGISGGNSGLLRKLKNVLSKKGKGSGLFGKGFVSQYDPRYANKSYGGTNIADAGCAPAVASMAASAMGKNLSMNSAIAMGNRYTTSQGTDADYFGSALGSQGISTSYLDGKGAIDQLRHNKPVIMLGQDSSNTSKANSPFGPGGHYVLGRGFDKQGNVIIQDPEMGGTTKYSPSILNSVRAAIGKGSGLYGKGSYTTNETKDVVYKFLIENGFSPAAAAGIMGNMQQESGINPAMIQSNGAGPAAGIVQWENYNKWKSGSTTDNRFAAMANYAKSKGKDWTDLISQLEFMNKEFSSKTMGYWLNPKNSPDEDIKKAGFGNYTKKDGTYVKDGTFAKAGLNPNIHGVTLAEFKALTDPELAARYFEASFERAGSPIMANRLNAAREYYNLYSGKSITDLNKSSFVNYGSNREIIKCDFDQTVTGNNNKRYHVIIEDRLTKKQEEIWSKNPLPKGRVTIKSTHFDSASRDGSQVTYGLTYTDGKTYRCRNKSGIENITLYQGNTNGPYYITYADGSHEWSKVRPSYLDYPDDSASPDLSTKDWNWGSDDDSYANTETTSMGILERIRGIVSSGLSAVFSGNDVSEAIAPYVNGTYTTTSYSDGTTSGPSGAQISAADYSSANVPLLDKKVALVNNALNKEKTEIYNQSYREQVRNGVQHSDCSSFAGRMYKNNFGVSIGGNTEAQWTAAKNGTSPMKVIDNNKANRPNYNLLQPGDLVYWYTPGHRGGRADDVSHVEIYAGDNKLIGQDAGTGKYGPRIKDYSSFRTANGSKSDRYLGVTRIRPDMVGAGSGLMGYYPNYIPNDSYNKYSNYFGKGADISSNAYNNLIANSGTRTTVTPVSKTNNIIVTGNNKSNNSSMLEQLVSAILNLLTRIADINNKESISVEAIRSNSENLNEINELLGKYKQTKNSNKSSKSSNTPEIDNSFKSVVEQMAALAKG